MANKRSPKKRRPVPTTVLRLPDPRAVEPADHPITIPPTVPVQKHHFTANVRLTERQWESYRHA